MANLEMADGCALETFISWYKVMGNYTDLYPLLGYSFKKGKLLKQALTLGFGNHFSGYERLEFLGDRVLGVVIAEMLYCHFPNENEGDLARRFSDLTGRKHWL